ncbi:MAG: tRNA pseudouridine(38-40) synthase TruA [Leptolyngbya sp. SIO3F4]|nr:tRNA pseudouridine(38-40) synthase TruA [Leptolyngbya sp. SIO3F4]
MADRTLANQLKAVSEDAQGSHRVAIIVQYQGTNFRGWQRQPNERTVQGDIETAIESLLGTKVTIHGAGRTDTGVHAAAQVAHFDVPKVIPAYRWASILNHRLSEDIVIRASAHVPNDWHAQYSAQWRRYRYTIYTDAYPNLFIRPYTWHFYHEPLDEQLMQSALIPMVGYHELTAFHRAGSSRAHSWVELQAAECSRHGPFVQVELQATGFLYGMVRLVMGLLVRVGRGRLAPAAFTELWQSGRRDLVKHAAPARGLCLLRVGYQYFPFASDAWFDTQPQLALHSTIKNLAV